jgi:hypothetical protein
LLQSACKCTLVAVSNYETADPIVLVRDYR